MDIDKGLKSAHNKCQAAGVKLTEKRAAVLEILLAADRPLSAYEVVAIYNQNHQQPMQPMSVYRILDLFVDVELVHKLASSNKYVSCAHLNCSHHHDDQFFVVCKSCGATKEITMSDTLVEQIKSSASDAGFKLVEPQFELSGVCSECGDNKE
ncbi:Fur family transcriptional regulator [Neiella marina]|uniref:Ferric uptake regulation protein n=1 Tax=Neiella marina TaxID=508461 RepID=A0A8J2U740_9GAMM|nr:Fur family transcriptional regulator [Neiella marina]GGA83570.1 Fur family transcriptional regulator [Neiella marina]